ncbi:MAG: DUF1622 domain-containing protein [Desulfuromonadales bacterium]|nr:DUF1622 domain-containing protein [Desulfuromonadales bacterium]
MTADFHEVVLTIAQWSVFSLELLGIGIIMLFSLYASFYNLYLLVKKGASEELFHSYRLQLARGILLGLEFLVAADIIKTVAVEFTFSSVGMLAIIVLIRTFLSFAIEMEMSGCRPWQKTTKIIGQQK